MQFLTRLKLLDTDLQLQNDASKVVRWVPIEGTLYYKE